MFATAQTMGEVSRYPRDALRERARQMDPQHVSHVTPQLFELRLADYDVKGASIDCGRHGTTFAFTIGPLPDSTLAVLNGVARDQGRICLYCCGEPLLVDLVAMDRKPHAVRIVGRVVESDSDAAHWNAA